MARPLRRPSESGQSTVEFALLALSFFLAFFIVIQLALVAVAKHELNHLTFQAARIWSLQKSDKIGDALKQATTSFKAARGNSRSARYLADNLRARVDKGRGRVTFTSYIPLLIPGAAHVIQNSPNAGGRGSPTGRDVRATVVVEITREPEVLVPAKRHPARPYIRWCTVGKQKASRRKPKDPPCYDNDGL